VTDALGGETSFTSDPNGNLQSVTDARRGPSTTYVYDAMDRIVRRTDPLLRAETYAYDAADNVLTFTSRKNQLTTSIYDALNRRTKATYADTSTTTYTRDKGNRLTRVVDSIGGTLTRTYDTLDRLTKETTPQGTVAYTYNAAGRRKTMTVTGQPTVSYQYDNANRLTRITKGTSIVSMAYDVAGRRTNLTLPNGIVTEYTYDAASRLTALTYKQGAAVLGDVTYAYDAVGHRTHVAGSFARTGLPQPVGSATYNAGNQQTTFGSQTLAYDLNGNLTSDGVRAYTWNARNQLAGIAAPGLGVTFKYDGIGRRTSKTVGGTATNFVYDGLTSVQQTGATTVTLLTGLGIDEYFTRTDTAGLRAFLTDALGSTLALTDSAGTIQTQYTYDPFGSTTSSGAASANALQYAGRENDGTGLYYFRARYYQPGLHRFISEDRAARAGGNPYTYVGNSPLNAIDPFGLFTIVIYGGAASSGPGGSSASSGNNAGLTNLGDNLQSRGERVAPLNSGQVQDAIRLATQAQAAGEPVYIVGHSLGGSTGIDAALQLPQPPTHLYTIDPFLPNQNIPDNIPTTNFLQRDALPFGSYLQGQNVENVLIDGLGFAGHFTITDQVQGAIAEQILSRRK
jgi:RHS repeat-associated protein